MDDFADPIEDSVVENDPWSESTSNREALTIGGLKSRNHSPIDQSEIQTEAVSSTPKPMDDEAIDMLNDSIDDLELRGRDTDVDLYDFALGDYFEDSVRLDAHDDDGAIFDEPEPQAEFDPELAEPLYESEGVIANMVHLLDLDAILAEIEPLSEGQRIQIVQILSEFSARKLASTLDWMSRKSWTGQSLLRYLEFRDLWENNAQWWGYYRWSCELESWWELSNRYCLSRDGCYYLAQTRCQFDIDEIIDESWLDDWNGVAAWRFEFYSFASFAIFRAGLREDEDWRAYLKAGHAADLESFGGSNVPSGSFKSLSGYPPDLQAAAGGDPYAVLGDAWLNGGPPAWFVAQNWYDSAEWHDHLGWPGPWVEAIHPYMGRESPEGSLLRVHLEMATLATGGGKHAE